MQGAVGLFLRTLVLSPVFDFADKPPCHVNGRPAQRYATADTGPVIAVGTIRLRGHNQSRGASSLKGSTRSL